VSTYRNASETSLSGTEDPTAQDVLEWLQTVPASASLDFRGTATHPGEFGVEPWRIRARWETQGPESASFQDYLAERAAET
jgi:hypothetical protein